MSAKVIDGLVVAAEMTGTSLSDPAIRGMAMELSVYPESVVLHALARCRRELKYRLTLADIIERISESDGRPSSDEAWGIAVKGFDEDATIVTNDEIEKASEAARAIYFERDRVGARMAFKTAYERIVADSRAMNVPVRWFASLGYDVRGRESVISEGVERGLLPSTALDLLPAPSDGNGTKLISSVAGLLSGPSHEGVKPSDEIRKKLADLRAELSSKNQTH